MCQSKFHLHHFGDRAQPPDDDEVRFAGLLLIRGEKVVRRTDVRVDWVGAIMLGAGFAFLLLGISEESDRGWASARVLGSLVLGVVALIAWTAVELRVDQPLADLRWLFTPPW